MSRSRAKPLGDNVIDFGQRREMAIEALDADLDDPFWEGLVRRAENGDRAAERLLRVAGAEG